jgi:hypothetical protein
MSTEHGSPGIPVTWGELVRHEGGAVAARLPMVAQIPALIRGLAPISPPALSLGGPAEILAKATALLGPEVCRPYLDILAAELPAALAASPGAAGLRANDALGALGCANLARCYGAGLPVPAEAAVAEWLRALSGQAARLDEPARVALAFAALAEGDDQTIRALIMPEGGFTAGRTFQFDTAGLLAYLAAARAYGAPPEAVAPAWAEFLLAFPRKLAAGSLGWHELFWAARSALRPPDGATVADALSHQVLQLVAGGG